MIRIKISILFSLYPKLIKKLYSLLIGTLKVTKPLTKGSAIKVVQEALIKNNLEGENNSEYRIQKQD